VATTTSSTPLALADLLDEAPNISDPFLIVALRKLEDRNRALDALCLKDCDQGCSDLWLTLAILESAITEGVSEVDLRADVVGVVRPEGSVAEPEVAHLATIEKSLVLLGHGVGGSLELNGNLSALGLRLLIGRKDPGGLESAQELVHLELAWNMALSEDNHEVAGPKPVDECAPGSIPYRLLFHVLFLL